MKKMMKLRQKKENSEQSESRKSESRKSESEQSESRKSLKQKKKEMKVSRNNCCTKIIIITKIGSFVTNSIEYGNWEEKNNFRKWLMIDEF